MRGFWYLSVGGVLLALGGATGGCAGGRCSGVTCRAGEACDPTDGVCKCGAQVGADGGIGGTICGAGETCDPVLQACLGDLCASKVCTDGNTCDAEDGVCKCGGKVCAPGHLCDNALHICSSGGDVCTGVTCAAGFSCDPIDGRCKCKDCPVDPCAGVHCAAADEGNQCIQGICRCGKGNGELSVTDPVCGRTEHCQDGQCRAILGCESVPRCYGYEVCNPLDLQCHCGSRGAAVCQPGEICQSYGGPNDPYFGGDAGPDYDGGEFFACRAVNDCHQTACPDNQICDPNRAFNCVCENAPGQLGPACEQNQYCIALDTTQPPACVPKCNPYVQQECELGDAGLLFCYAEFIGNGATGAAVCEAPNPQDCCPGDPCGRNSDCGPGQGCWDLPLIIDGHDGPMARLCRPYCDTGPGTSGGTHDCAPPLTCTPVGQVLANGEVVQIGFCR